MRLFTPILVIVSLLSSFQISGQTADPVVLDGRKQRQIMSPGTPDQVVVFEHLIPGERYRLVVPEGGPLGGCIVQISPLGELAQAAESVQATDFQLEFTAVQPTQAFRMRYSCAWKPGNAPVHHLSLVCGTCTKKDLRQFLDASLATLEVQTGASAEELVREVLIGGDCFDITGVTFSGNGAQIGRFTNGLTNIGYASGMIMATGDINVAVGPNDQDNASMGGGGGTPDPDLTAMSGSGSIFDMANIEFDFTPTQSPLTFEYVFASEEYCEYVGSQFNDAFGFFISGPGINGPFGGAANIAVIPGNPGVYVTINNVNHQSFSGLYVNNTGPNGSLCGQQPSFAAAVNEVQFDGFTRKMVAIANVIPCQTYRIKLKIGDVGDGIFDSAVFLKAGSFDGGGNASVDFVVNGDPDIDVVYESCGEVKLIFDRVGGNLNTPLPVQYTIGGTATPGADYSPIPAVVVIPSGQDKVEITVNITNDLIIEGDETIVLTLNNPCSCLEPREILTIRDLPRLEALADTVVICGSGAGTLTATGIGGVEPYRYQWSNGSTDPSITPFVGVSTNFRVTVTDDCGKTAVATARIIVSPLPNAQLLPPAPQICPGSSALININFNGTGPFEITYSLNGDDQPAITGIYNDPFQLEIFDPGLYRIVSVTDSLGCVGNGQGLLLITESNLNLTGVATNITCTGGNNGSINTTVVGGQGPYNYTWVGPVNIANIPDPLNLTAGNYQVTVTDGFGCIDSLSFLLAAPNPMIPSVDSVSIANCANPNGGTVNLSVTGGAPNYTYNWSNGVNVQDPTNLAAGNYTVTITDQNNCKAIVSATIPGDFDPPTASANVLGQLTCYNPQINLNGAGSSEGPEFRYAWSAGPGNITGGANTLTPTVNQAGAYTILVTDQSNGCTSSASVSVTADQTLPSADAGPTQTITCSLLNPVLDGSGSSQGPDFTYQWTASQGGVIVSGGSTANPTVGSTGLYAIVVTNAVNGCTRTDTVSVSINTQAPSAVVAQPPILTCTANNVTLNGSNSTPTGLLSFQWSTVNGAIQSGQNTPNAVVTAAGEYTLVVTNTVNGCTDSRTVTVLPDNSIPAVTATAGGIITCAVQEVALNGAGSSAGANFTYQWTTTNGQIVSGANSLQAVAGAPGQYTLIVTNTSNNCTATFNLTVPADLTNPVADAGNNQVLDCTTPTLTLNGGGSSQGNNFIYSWTASNGGNILGGGNTLTPIINTPGTYTLQVTNTANGCVSSASTNILDDAGQPFIVMAAPDTLNCYSNQTILNAAGSSTGASFVYDWSGPGILSGDSTQNLVVNQPGLYVLTIVNSDNGCFATQPVNVAQNIINPPADAGPDRTLNCNNPTIGVGGSGNPTGSNFTFSWFGPGILSGGNSPAPTVNQSGNYSLTVTNTTNGCTSVDITLVNADFVAPSANAGQGFELTCVQNTYTLQATGSIGSNFQYAWTTVGGSFSTPPNVLQPIVNAPGIYTLTVTNTTNGCTKTASVQITQAADIPIVNAGVANLLTCDSLTVTLNGAGTAVGPTITYSWSAGPGGNITGGANTLTPKVNAPGVYTLTVFDSSNNCSDFDTVYVPQNITPPPANAGAPVVLTCYNPSLALTGSVAAPGNYTYQWVASNGGAITGGSSTLTPTINQAGTYTLTVRNTANGCSSVVQTTATTNQTPPIALIANPQTLTCAVVQTTLNANASSTGNMDYDWITQGGNFLDLSNPRLPMINAPGIYQLLLTNLDNGCTASAAVQVNQNIQLPNAEAGAAVLLTCANPSLQLNGAGSSAGPNFTYTWSGPGILSGANTLTPTVNAAGAYTLTVRNQTNECASSDVVQVNIDTLAPIIALAPPGLLTCKTPAVTLDGNGSQSGTNIAYAWSTTNGILQGITNAVTATAAAPGQYRLLVTNTSNGCTSTRIVTVGEDIQQPNAEAGPTFLLTCSADEATLQGSGSTGSNYSYTWNTSNGRIVSGAATLNPVVDEPGLYTLVVTNQTNGCTRADGVTITRESNVPTNFTFDLDPPSCLDNDGLISFTAVTGGYGPYFYSIDGGDTFYPELDFENIAPGSYTLRIQDANGCEFQKQLVVPQAPDPQITIVPEIQLSLGDSTVLNAQLPAGYPLNLIDTILWEPMEGLHFSGNDLLSLLRPGVRPFRSIEYKVTLISGEGCKAEDRVVVRVDREPKIYVPNAFSPWDSDGENDRVLIFADGDQVLEIKAFRIFDRWGSMVFEDYNFQPNDPAHGWDGTNKGKFLTPAVFVYTAEVLMIDGRIILLKGDITIVR